MTIVEESPTTAAQIDELRQRIHAARPQIDLLEAKHRRGEDLTDAEHVEVLAFGQLISRKWALEDGEEPNVH